MSLSGRLLMQGADMALLDDDNAIKAITANRSAHYEPMGWHHWPEHPWLSYQFRRGLGRRLHLPWRNLVHRLAARGLSPSKFSLFGEDRLTDAQSESVRRALGASNLLGRERVLVKEMSYGEQRQLEVAMALVGTPRLLLLDEPAAGLSPSERSALADIIRALPRDLTVILIEHDMDLALALVDFVTVMQNGKVIVESNPTDIRSNALVQEVYLGKPREAPHA